MEATPSELCERVLDMVGDRAEAEVTVASGRSALTRFANSHIHQNVADDSWRVRLKAIVDGRQATASTSRVTGEALERLVDQSLEAARVRPVDPEWPGLAPPAAALPTDRYDEATHLARPDVRARVVGAFVAAGRPNPASRSDRAARAPASAAESGGLEAAGFCDSVGRVVAFANSAGQRLGDRMSRATIEAIHRGESSDGRGWQTASRLADLDGAAAGRTAAEKARAGADPLELEPGRYEVVLEPPGVADLLDFLAWYGFNAKAHAEGLSFVEIGKAQLDPAVSISDDARHPGTIGLGFDAEGTPKRPLDLVAAGVSAALVQDRRTARRAGTESTGHAVAGGESWGPVPSNLRLLPGEQSTDDLVASVGRGLLITELWYTRVLDPKTQVVTGLTRNGTFLIEGGRVVGGVRNLRFTQSYVDALAPGQVLGVGNDARLFGGALVPSLHLASWNFTGGASG